MEPSVIIINIRRIVKSVLNREIRLMQKSLVKFGIKFEVEG